MEFDLRKCKEENLNLFFGKLERDSCFVRNFVRYCNFRYRKERFYRINEEKTARLISNSNVRQRTYGVSHWILFICGWIGLIDYWFETCSKQRVIFIGEFAIRILTISCYIKTPFFRTDIFSQNWKLFPGILFEIEYKKCRWLILGQWTLSDICTQNLLVLKKNKKQQKVITI